VLLAVYNRKDDHHERAVRALGLVDRLVVSPMVLTELDYHLTTRISGKAAADALAAMRAWASTDRLKLATVGWPLLTEAEHLMRTYSDHDAIGMTDAVNAVLAWALPQPVVLALDHHYRDIIAPRTTAERPLQVSPSSRWRQPSRCVGANIRSTAGRMTTAGPGDPRAFDRSSARVSGVVRTPGTPKDSARAT